MKNTYIKYPVCLLFVLICSKTLFSQGVWTQKVNFGGGAVSEATGFSIGNKGYICGNISDLWEYDQASDTWSQKAAFPATLRNSAAAFSIGAKGYIGTGGSFNDFYEWDQNSNTWTTKANFGGSGREGAFGFANSSNGFIGMGGNYLSDLWKYDPVLDVWTQVANCPGPGRYHAPAFCINNKGYICSGFNGNFLNDLWEYDPVLNAWSQLASLPGTPRDRADGWSIGTKGYIIAGWSGSQALADFYEWDQPSNTWTSLPALPGLARYNAVGLAIGNKGYIGTGVGAGADWWEYGSNCAMQVTAQSSTCFSSCDGSATVTTPDPGAVVSYLWNTTPAQSTVTATGLCSGTYNVTMTDTTGCSNTIPAVITSPPAITSTAVFTEPVCFGAADGGICITASGGTGTFSSYIWSNGQTTSCAGSLSSGTYSITVTDNSGCTGSSSFVLNQPSQLVATLTHNNASCPTCANGNATANVTGGSGPYVFSWSNGVTNSAFINGLLPGIYTCCITDANGCSICDSTVVGSPSGLSSQVHSNQFIVTSDPFGSYIEIAYMQKVTNDLRFKITDLSGRLLQEGMFLNNVRLRVDVRSMVTGFYFLEIRSGSYAEVKMVAIKGLQ